MSLIRISGVKKTNVTAIHGLYKLPPSVYQSVLRHFGFPPDARDNLYFSEQSILVSGGTFLQVVETLIRFTRFRPFDLTLGELSGERVYHVKLKPAEEVEETEASQENEEAGIEYRSFRTFLEDAFSRLSLSDQSSLDKQSIQGTGATSDSYSEQTSQKRKKKSEIRKSPLGSDNPDTLKTSKELGAIPKKYDRDIAGKQKTPVKYDLQAMKDSGDYIFLIPKEGVKKSGAEGQGQAKCKNITSDPSQSVKIEPQASIVSSYSDISTPNSSKAIRNVKSNENADDDSTETEVQGNFNQQNGNLPQNSASKNDNLEATKGAEARQTLHLGTGRNMTDLKILTASLDEAHAYATVMLDPVEKFLKRVQIFHNEPEINGLNFFSSEED